MLVRVRRPYYYEGPPGRSIEIRNENDNMIVKTLPGISVIFLTISQNYYYLAMFFFFVLFWKTTMETNLKLYTCLSAVVFSKSLQSVDRAILNKIEEHSVLCNFTRNLIQYFQ